jgi:hypothetical protein
MSNLFFLPSDHMHDVKEESWPRLLTIKMDSGLRTGRRMLGRLCKGYLPSLNGYD